MTNYLKDLWHLLLVFVEAGSYGQNTKGMINYISFTGELVSVVEQKIVWMVERMLGCAESILQKLDIPYQIVLLSTGDIGFS